ncbi:acetyl-CoA carboxylase biotin carboxylase subunit family protein [Streptomyces sp. NPDC003023]|uniref:ATP-grasp domain-containing protein n=1 Tax=Streptomyces sp. NPDC003023 TaxID=3364675 RepID=UPI0036AFC067
MKILVVHQVPYRKISYHLGVDHDRHEVTYIGRAADLAEVPDDLRCTRIALGDGEDLVAGVTARTAPGDGYDKVLSLSEFGILQATYIRDHLGLAGPSAKRIEKVRDKVRMKQALAGSGIRYPRFVASVAEGEALPWSGRTVLKPRQGASSQGVMIFDSARDALAAYALLPDRDGIQLEEHIDGDILHVDGLLCDGRLLELSVSRYVNKPVEYADGMPLGSHQVRVSDAHRGITERVVEALEIDEGCIHLELFHTADDELVFLEIANRVGGAGVVTAHARHSGVHLPSHEIAVRLGVDRPEPSEPSGRHHGWLAFPGHHLPGADGHAVDLPDRLRLHPCVDRIHLLAPDQALPDHITYQEWEVPVFIEASHTDPEVLGAFLRECAATITVRTAAESAASPAGSTTS